jgi:MYXO-CTERM domain-containing protein
VRTLGVSARGSACTAGNQCADSICTVTGVCCDTPCDGLCRTCTVEGCVGTPVSDTRCGSGGATLSCGALSTTCRLYDDLPANLCAGFGQCAEPGTLAECTRFHDATDGTACSEVACSSGAGGACHACACVFPGATQELTPPPWALAPGCSVGAGRPAAAAAPFALALAALALVGWRRSRRRPLRTRR